MSVGGSILRSMSVSHWKLINQLKEYVSKSSSNEKGFLFVLNKEWASVLQKLTMTYDSVESHTRRNVDTDTAIVDKKIKSEKEPPKTDSKEPAAKEDEGYSLPQVLTGLKLKKNSSQNVEMPEESIPKWKSSIEAVSKISINSRTRHVIASIANAESVQSRLKRLEDLASHLNQYPEAKHLAIKEGVLRLLLQTRKRTDDELTLAVLRETLAVLGHVDPLPGRGIRILSIDGGGIRGVLVIELLKKLEELTGKRIYEMFDYICGVSTGAILLCVLVPQKKTLTELSEMYKELSTKIFTQSAFWGTSNLVWSHSYYNTEMWEQLLKIYVGETPLIRTARDPLMPKLSMISAVVNLPRVTAYIFRNYSLPYKVQSPYMGGTQYKLWEAVRASAAAPSYFEEYRLGELLHQDGGVLVNNPTAVAIHEAKQLWPGCPIQCVVSFGTGRTNPVICGEDVNSSSWKTKFFKILDSATDTEAVHTMLNDLLPGSVYFRFNPYVTEMVTMDEIRPDKIGQLEQDAAMYYRRNEETFQEAAKALMHSSTCMQRVLNWINLHRELLGIK
ncbi:calcium-independent phospholipase A2-gamma-like [Zootermopsis nevadensis]|uniref:Calcium-independent phospholipase A2-gamma n=1 Tax=Zootermopsis nevadensis TaxID=136037 RepID=A0A067QMK2_ZOONE|nr:calcium-independent phospholipase A2-gamma-like [Zootermopsis nevadensis]XP_021937928.1 calcium-independent phospholipase A2-gamma-like [Zootermopsis nevadensis]XP_021937929.1 calcium-independent phospholipase A2-gamma-like [Zootermopsis nevadensis]XP_021937930.1 calcium-independent phospholipase A2-gamma-like [Zootermopsis nevadensis]KDR09436.1 Calcium-independent phospholipase A2-gamma [Zootermopsis nevadensis]